MLGTEYLIVMGFTSKSLGMILSTLMAGKLRSQMHIRRVQILKLALPLKIGIVHSDQNECADICFQNPMALTSLHSNQKAFDIPIQSSKIRQIAVVVSKPSLY